MQGLLRGQVAPQQRPAQLAGLGRRPPSVVCSWGRCQSSRPHQIQQQPSGCYVVARAVPRQQPSPSDKTQHDTDEGELDEGEADNEQGGPQQPGMDLADEDFDLEDDADIVEAVNAQESRPQGYNEEELKAGLGERMICHVRGMHANCLMPLHPMPLLDAAVLHTNCLMPQWLSLTFCMCCCGA